MAILVNFEEIGAAGKQDWRLDNTALKSIRFQGESPLGTPWDWSGVDLTHSDPYFVLTIKRGNGPEFELVEPQQEWSWRRMLNRFDDVNLRRIIGPGITGIFCKPMGNPLARSFDHRRQHFAHRVSFADIDGEPPCIPVWDFVIKRGDGVAVRLHPHQTSKKVFLRMIRSTADGPEPEPEVVPATNSAATASSADTRGDGADWRNSVRWQDWRDSWSRFGAAMHDWSGMWHDWSAWSSDGAWHDCSSDASTDTWGGCLEQRWRVACLEQRWRVACLEHNGA